MASVESTQEFSFDQKLAAIQGLRPHAGNSVWWRYHDAAWARDKRWYCAMDGIEMGGDGFLSSAMGAGATPEAALDDLWRVVTEGAHYVVLDAYKESRMAFRWVGFMWERVEESTDVA